jgi:hypothetical protein
MRDKLIAAFPAYTDILKTLSERSLRTLDATVDPETDDLIHLDSEGFSVNHGSVGTRGVRYDFENCNDWIVYEKRW